MIDSFTGRYFWLSNFYVSPVRMYGETYPSVEHAFQAAKVQPGRSGSAAMRKLIRDAKDSRGRPNPGWAKRLGQRVPLREGWDEMKVGIMRILIERKFEVPELRYLLICTGSEELVEGNNWNDDFWGKVRRPIPGSTQSLPISHQLMRDYEWVGENHLGRILMEVRDEMLVE